VSDVERAGICRNTDVKCGRLSNRLAADVLAAIQFGRQIGETNRIDFIHGRRVRIVTDARRIAGDDQEIADSHRVRAEQIRLHADHVAVAAGVVQDGLD
jgi:hypothetical protein